MPSEVMQNKRPAMVKSADTLIIEQRLRACSVGDIVTYTELSKLLGRDVREHCRGNLTTALKSLAADRLIFGTITGEGMQRLDDSQKLATVDSMLQRSRRAAKRVLTRLSVTDFAALDADGQKKHLVLSAAAGAVELLASQKAQKTISTQVSNSVLPIGQTLSLFSK